MDPTPERVSLLALALAYTRSWDESRESAYEKVLRKRAPAGGSQGGGVDKPPVDKPPLALLALIGLRVIRVDDLGRDAILLPEHHIVLIDASLGCAGLAQIADQALAQKFVDSVI